MPDTIAPQENGQVKPLQRAASLLIATDGFSQSDAAIAFARALPPSLRESVLVINVVDHAPIPWGNVDRHLVRDYEHELYQDAQWRTKEQIARVGDESWPVNVRYGNPGETITAAAKECGARLILIGLGEHGASARIFGNETALRVMRQSGTPVLAVTPGFKTLAQRVVVAMDFREASIEAARLALEIAAPGATVTVAHVIPWDRREYVPGAWMRDYEAHVNEQLLRVIGWLDRKGEFQFERKTLYGRAGSAIPTLADALNADLIVTGTHSRGTLSRMFMGDTLARIVRGAHRSVLVLPAAAAFSGFHKRAHTGREGEKEPEWPAKLEDFSRRNAERLARLEIDNPLIGAQVEMSGYRFLGASYDPPSRRAQLMFGAKEAGAPHLSRGISNVKSIEVLAAPGGTADTALSIVSDDGQTLLVFDKKGEG